jgi:hypothetical protein
MASIYTIGARTPAAAAGAAYATIHNTSTDVLYVREIGIFLSAATATSVGLIRPSNTPVATTSQLGQAHDTARPAGTGNIDTAWSTAPTIGTLYLRRITLPATVGAGVIWAFPPDMPLILNASQWLVLWNFGGSAGAACDVYATWDE